MEQNNYREIESIVNELKKTIDSPDRKIVKETYQEYLKRAINITHNKHYEELIPYVKKATISSYIRLGNEGSISSSENGNNYTYEDIEEKMRKNLIADGLRRIK